MTYEYPLKPTVHSISVDNARQNKNANDNADNKRQNVRKKRVNHGFHLEFFSDFQAKKTVKRAGCHRSQNSCKCVENISG